MDFLKNIWVKKTVSFLTVLYLILIIWIDYMSVFYNFKYKNAVVFGILFVLISIFFTACIIYSRDQLFTTIVALLLMVAALPNILFNFGNWLLIVPPFIVALIAFFSCKANETFKTVAGTLFILMYIVGSLAFFLMSKLFVTPVEKKVMEEGVSTSGIYRYQVLEVFNNSTGGMQVKVEPNDKDKDFKLFVFEAKGYDKIVYRSREHVKPAIRWDENDILYINDKQYEFTIGKREFTFE